MPGHIEDFVAFQRCLGDRADFTARDADVPHGIETARRIHDMTVSDDEVMRRKWKRGGKDREDKACIHEVR